ncbi:MAG: ATP-binding protein [bacterium]
MVKRSLLGLLLLLSGMADAAWSDIHNQHFRYWNASDGLAESWSYGINRSPLGHILISHGEVGEFSWLDGYFVHVLPSPGAYTAVQESPAGQFWAMSPKGLQTLIGKQWVEFPVAEIAGADGEVHLLPGVDDQVLFLLPDRLMAFHAGRQESTVIKQSDAAHIGRFISLHRASAHEIWVTGEHGIARVRETKSPLDSSIPWEDFPCPESAGLRDFVYVAEAPDGALYSSAESPALGRRVVAEHTASGWRTAYVNEDDNQLLMGFPGPDDYFFVAKMNPVRGLLLSARVRGQETVLEKNEVMAGRFYNAELEPGGVFWFATSQGVVRYAPPTWRTPSATAGNDQTFHAIEEDSAGRIWFLNRTSLLCLENGVWEEYPFPAYVYSFIFQTTGLCPLPNGKLAIRTDTPYLLEFDPSTGRYEGVSHPRGFEIGYLRPRKKGGAWVQTSDPRTGDFGLEIYDGVRFQPVANLKDQWKFGELRYLLEAENGDLWLGGVRSEGLGLYRKGKLHQFSSRDGYTDRGTFCFLELGDGKIWTGGRDKIMEYDGKSWREVLTGLDSVRSMILGRDGGIWVACGVGLLRYWNGSWVANTHEEGLPNTAIYRVFEDSRGRIWAGTASGLSLYHPDADQDPPETLIPAERNVKEAPPAGDYRIVFGGIDKWKYTGANRLLFSYRMDGGKWSPFIPEPLETFTGLSFGPHRLEVRAMDRNWNIDPTPAVFDFTVLEPWYYERGFLYIAIAGIVIILLLTGYSTTRHYQLRKTFRQMQEANEQLQLANQKLRDLDQMKTAFVSQASHDLRTPLTTIKSSLDILMRGVGGGLSEKQLSIVERAHRSVNRLNDLVNDVLDLSRIESGRMILNKCVIPMRTLMEDLVHENRLVAKQRQIALELQCGDGLFLVEADAGKMERVVSEFIGNALKYTPEGGRVTVRLYQTEPSRIVIEIQDTGIGMSPEEMNRIFDRFYRIPRSVDMARGTGLGLSIVKELVEMHGGQIQVQSKINEGTRFTIRLPVAQPGNPESAGKRGENA